MTKEQSIPQHASGEYISQARDNSNSNLNVVNVNTTPQGPFKPLHQLRMPVADFVGREAEIERLVNSLREAASKRLPAIGVIWGLGGVGKTQLACTVAQKLRADFPDAQLFLELQGVGERPLTTERILQNIILAFDAQAQLPEDLAGLRAYCTSLLDGRRVLIVADNASSADQIRELEPPPGCALLVTSRHHSSLPGAHICDLLTLSSDEAEHLVRAICPRLGGAAPRLAQLCGRLPLALRISASLLAIDQTRNVQRYIQALEAERMHYLSDPDSPEDDPSASVEASLNLSYRALNDAGQRSLCQISIFLSSFDLVAAEAVISIDGIKPGAGDARAQQAALEQAGLPTQPSDPPQRQRGRAVPPRVESLLSILHRRSLLEYDSVAERYSLHDLVRVFAAERLESEGEQLRYVRHYLRIAQQADELYDRGYEEIITGLTLFDRERAHIDAAWTWAREQPFSPVFDDISVSFASATMAIGSIRYDQRERLLWLQETLQAANRLKRKGTQGSILNAIGSCYLYLGEARQAVEYYQRVLSIFVEINNRRGEGAALGNLGIAYRDLGDARQAIEYHQQSLAIAREVGNRNSEGVSLGNLGLAYRDLGDARQAIEFHQQALAISRALGDRHGEGADLGNLGRVSIDLGELEQAIAYIQQSLALHQAIGDRRREAYAYHYLALAYAADEELEQAHIAYNQALDLSRSVGARRLETQILIDIGKTQRIQGDLVCAVEHLSQALALAEESGYRMEAARASWNLGLAYAQQGELSRALAALQVRVDYEREIGHTRADEDAATLAQYQAHHDNSQ